MNLQDVSHIHIPDGDVRMIHDSDNRLLWGAVGYNVLFSGNTFQQSYEGKNLLAYPYYNTTKTENGVTFTDNGDGTIQINGTVGTGECLFWITRDIWSYNTANIVVPAGTYTISPTGDQNVYLYITAYGETQGLLGTWKATTASTTFTVSEKASLTVRISVKPSGSVVSNLVAKLQLESGSTATTWEKFVGGQPSPNPEYPQQIQTVTGTQTISINGTNYPISLGSLELCKLGNYQDYIWKDGEDWKVHRETKRVTVDGSQRNGNLTQYGFAQIRIDSEALYVTAPPVSYCSNLPSHDIYDSLPKTYAVRSSATQCNFRLYFTPQLEDFDAYLDWCAENKPSVVAPLQQSAHTDTVITDTNLIAQLEAIYNLVRRYGYNFVVSVSGNNLPIIIDRTLL